MKNKINIKKSDAINFFGSKVAIANILGTSKQAVGQWPDVIPEQSAWPLYYLTKGKIPAEICLPEETQKSA